MKIYRGPNSTSNWDLTDSKQSNEWAVDWKPGNRAIVDGTIDKSGQRHTALGVEIEVDDIITLSNALMVFQRQEIQSLRENMVDLERKCELLKDIFRRIAILAEKYKQQTTDHRENANAISTIATHYWLNKPGEPRVEGLDW